MRENYKDSVINITNDIFNTENGERMRFVGKEAIVMLDIANANVIAVLKSILPRGPNGSELPVNWNPYLILDLIFLTTR